MMRETTTFRKGIVAMICIVAIFWVIGYIAGRGSEINEPLAEYAPVAESAVPQQPASIGAVVQEATTSERVPQSENLYDVVKVVDGDTIDVNIDGTIERLRLIGINTPEVVDPRKPVECFGKEASARAKKLLSGTRVILESDPSQGERDKYDRLLRHVFYEDGKSFNLQMIAEGYAYEYTYDGAYKYQREYKAAQKEAETKKLGLWGAVCDSNIPETTSVSLPVSSAASSGCVIKGNISASGEKIYHMIGCGSYAKTVINESDGERWFCTESEARDAGWRKALNCK